MKAGITYDLRDDYLAEGFTLLQTAEFDRQDTITAIEHALRMLGYETDRIGHVRNLVTRLAKGERWDIVFNIAEGMYGIGREAQVPAILDAWNIPYVFSDPLILSLTLHKGMTKRVIRDLGIPTPDFAVLETRDDLAQVRLEYPLFVKPVAEGTGKGITPMSLCNTPGELAVACEELLREYGQPVLVEEFLPGREFTVGITGTGDRAEVLGVMEVVLLANAQQDVYSYENKENCEECVKYVLVDDDEARQAAEISLRAWRGLGCRDGGRVDLRSDANGVPNFMEVNPLAGLHPEHSDLPIICTLSGLSYIELMRRIMDSAVARILPIEREVPVFVDPAARSIGYETIGSHSS